MRSTDTVFFKHKHITNPTVTPADAIVHAAKELIEALKGKVPGSLGDTSLDGMAKVEKIFAKKSQRYKAMSKVVEQPPTVRKEAATPTRVETPTAPELRPIQSQPNEDDDDDESIERPWHNEFGRLLDKASSQLPSQNLPFLGANTNEGPNGVLSQTHGIDRKSASTKQDTVDQHELIKVKHKNIGTNNSTCECSIATPKQGCARLGNLNFPKNGKIRV